MREAEACIFVLPGDGIFPILALNLRRRHEAARSCLQGSNVRSGLPPFCTRPVWLTDAMLVNECVARFVVW